MNFCQLPTANCQLSLLLSKRSQIGEFAGAVEHCLIVSVDLDGPGSKEDGRVVSGVLVCFHSIEGLVAKVGKFVALDGDQLHSRALAGFGCR